LRLLPDLGHYEERLKLPLLGIRITKWLLCAFLSPTRLLVKCVEGFVGKVREYGATG
jgi:hypothetical protein